IIGLLIPLSRPGGNDEGAGRDHVGFEAARISLDAYAHIASTGKGSHLVRVVGHAEPRRVCLANCVRSISGSATREDYIGDISKLLDRAHRDHVFCRSRGFNSILHAAGAAVITEADVPGGEDKEKRLRTGYAWQGVAK